MSGRASGKALGLALGPLLLVALLLSPPLPGAPEAAQRARLPSYIYVHFSLGVLLWTATWWVSECVPLGLAGLVPVIAFSVAGILAWREALVSFMDPTIWIFMGGFTIAQAFKVWGLDRRIAVKVGSLYRGGRPELLAFFAAALPTFILTISGSITAATSIVFPIVLALLRSMGFKPGSRYAEATMLALGQAATAGAMLFLVSTPPNLIAKKVIEDAVPGFNLTFIDWLVVGTPHALIGLVVTWAVVFALVKPEVADISEARKQLLQEAESLPPMSRGEKMVLAVFATTLALWIAPGLAAILAAENPQLEPLATAMRALLPEAAPAVLAILLLGLLRASGRPLLTWKEIEEGIDWNVVFLFGGGIALSAGLQKGGFADWVSQVASAALGARPTEWQVVAVSALMGFAITYPASNTAAALISAPIAATVAKALGYNPVPSVIAAALACSISSALPSTTPPMAMVYGSGMVSMKNMFKVGMVADTLRLVLLILLTPHLANILLALKGYSAP